MDIIEVSLDSLGDAAYITSAVRTDMLPNTGVT